MSRTLRGAMALLLAAWLLPSPGWAAPRLVPLARPGVWPGVSGIIAYRGRVWFVNSEKFADHNSADLYTYDPATGSARYERSLFSQDAGDPLVWGGLLYWPFEDPRFSAGRGEFMVTNGRAWSWRTLSEGLAFHIHAMIAHRGRLYAATSAWRALVQESADRGASWRVVYDHPTPRRRVSRITSLASFGGRLYAGLTADYREGDGLLRREGGAFVPLAGWPKGRATRSLTPYRGWLYAVNRSDAGLAVWRTDGRRVERVRGLDGRVVRDLAAGGDALWAVSAGGGRGALLRSGDGLRWEVAFPFRDEAPIDVALIGGRVYVGTVKPGGGGALWGPPRGGGPLPMAAEEIAPLPRRPPALEGARLHRALERLDRALASPETYRSRSAILRPLEPFALAGGRAAGEALSARLGRAFPRRSLRLFTRQRVGAGRLARWYLMRAIALTGGGRIPPALLAVPWTEPRNRAEKYFHPAPAAAWAVARLGQADEATLAALIARLGEGSDPRWLRGDIIGALTALTGMRFGHDRAAWRSWWRARRRPKEAQ